MGKLICFLLFLLASFSCAANSQFYLGADAQYHDFNIVRKENLAYRSGSPAIYFFGGVNLNEFISIEAGHHSYSSRKSSSKILSYEIRASKHLKMPEMVFTRNFFCYMNSKTSLSEQHIKLIAFTPSFKFVNIKLFSGIGLSRSHFKFNLKTIILTNEEPGQNVDFVFKKSLWHQTLTFGAIHKVNDRFSVRGAVVYYIKNIERKISTTYGIGWMYTF